MQAETGASGGPSHKGLVENLVEKAIEILPHQITGADPVPASPATSATHPYASGADTRVRPLLFFTLAYMSCGGSSILLRSILERAAKHVLSWQFFSILKLACTLHQSCATRIKTSDCTGYKCAVSHCCL